MAYRSAAALLALLLLPLALAAQNAGEWRTYGNDGAYTHYTPLDQIDASNVADLEIVWRWNGRNSPNWHVCGVKMPKRPWYKPWELIRTGCS